MDTNLTQYLIRTVSKRVKEAKHRKQRSLQLSVEDVEVILGLLEKQKALLEQKATTDTEQPASQSEPKPELLLSSGPVPAPAPAPISVAVDQQLLSLAHVATAEDADAEGAAR